MTDSMEHAHHFVFLRQEMRPTRRGWNDRIDERLVEDVYFCDGCLAYRRIPVRREEPSRTELNKWVEVLPL